MPLLNGNSDKVVANNIQELIDSYKQTGKIGNTSPKDEAHAQRIAIAIAYDKAGRTRPGATTKPRKVSRLHAPTPHPTAKSRGLKALQSPTSLKKPKSLIKPFFPKGK
jgi:hypothetical protein